MGAGRGAAGFGLLWRIPVFQPDSLGLAVSGDGFCRSQCLVSQPGCLCDGLCFRRAARHSLIAQAYFLAEPGLVVPTRALGGGLQSVVGVLGVWVGLQGLLGRSCITEVQLPPSA
ncbi:hypothetical protein D3C85_1166810 [compost metagenome]